MTRWRALLLTCALTFALPVVALERNYLKKSEAFCDVSKVLCLRGSITYEPNSRILNISARVQKQTEPGRMRLDFSGTTRQGFLRRTEIDLRIRGRHSEIINHSIRPDAPDVDNWALSAITFRPDEQD